MTRRIKEISKLAERLVKELRLEVPVDLDQLISDFDDIEIEYSTLQPEVDAITVVRKSDPEIRYSIRVNKQLQRNRQREAVARELGFIFLGYLRDYPELYLRGANEILTPANTFALCILMPTLIFINQVDRYRDEDGDADISSLASFFQVSPGLIKSRGYLLGLFRDN